MTPKLPRWIWPIGLALIVLNGLLFILQGLEATATHSSQESAILIISLTVGTAFVVWYWAAKCLRLRHDVLPGNSLLSRISLRHRIFIGIGLLALIALVLQGFRMSFNPALKQSEDFVRANEAVLASYGPIKDFTADALFWSVDTAPDGISTGKYTFDLIGAKRTGVVQIHWQEINGTYTATEIDELPQSASGHAQMLWKSK